MTKLTEMVNIGKEMENKLQNVGIDSAEKLAEIGSKEAYLRIKEVYPRVCLVHLYVLEGAITNTHYNCLPEETKKDLRAFSDKIKLI